MKNVKDIVKYRGLSLININNDDMVCKIIKEGRDFEKETTDFWLQAINSGDEGFNVDIGSYNGYYAMLSALDNKEAYLFEPNPRAFERICENVKLNNLIGYTHLVKAACGSSWEPVYLSKSDTKHICSSASVSDEESGLKVECVTFDEYFGYTTIFNCIKIDVEGYEIEVLKGMKETLTRRAVNFIITEALNVEAMLEQERFLAPFGYVLDRVADKRNMIWKRV